MRKLIPVLCTVALAAAISLTIPSLFHQKRDSRPLDVEIKKYPDSPDKYDLFHQQRRQRESPLPNRRYQPNYRQSELSKLKVTANQARRLASFDWQERGPGNVPGRTRGLLVLDGDSDKATWLAGSAGGGIWKTTDSGQSWALKTKDIPNLATTVLAKSESSDQILYAGTGEFFNSVGGVDGNGLYKSTDAGETWNPISATSENEDFRNTFRIIVDPDDANVLVVAVSETSGNLGNDDLRCSLYKSTDGGNTWNQSHIENNRIQDLVFHPDNFNIQYASVNSIGVLKSTDAGESWALTGNVLSSGRIELAIAPTDATRIYAAAQGAITSPFGDTNPTGANNSDIFVSYNSGSTWELLIEENNGINHNFFDGQGGYNNTIVVHPFDEDIIYVGGVDLWKVEVGSPSDEIPAVGAVDTTNIGFINFISFSASFFGGLLETGNNNEAVSLTNDDFVNVEIRFGNGVGQKAHRFSINSNSGTNGNGGPGVTPAGYLYEDYVDVPFEAWDVTNNKQLAISFRDQANDGKWDLVVRDDNDETIGREYFFINAVDYDAVNANSNIAKNGGHSYKQLYFMWPSLTEGFDFDPENLPDASIEITRSTINSRNRVTENISDSRAQYAGKNASTQTIGEQVQTELHPDHHNLVAVPIDNGQKTFKIINANDGGVFVSNTSTLPGVNDGDWTFSGHGYNTSQFYGMDKRPGKQEYIGGMQDNGSWRSPRNQEASATSVFSRQLTGDGFEAVWHYGDDNLLIGSSQGNAFSKSINGGKDWNSANAGYTESSSPFVSKLENSKNNPDVLYTVGGSGVWKSNDFADSWNQIPITEKWIDFGFVMDVKTSISDHEIVWSGGGMTEQSNLHVSTDGGSNFKATNNFEPLELLGRISGIETHPTEDSTAFVLFSFASGPKVIKTEDLGQTWVEISGFGSGLTSSNGFPNVAVNTLLVMPYNTSVIWVGTEIGVVESTDAGDTWHLLDSDLPAVSVWELKIVDDQVLAATHGRGIWSAQLSEINKVPFIVSYNEIVGEPPTLSVNLRMAYDAVEIYVDDEFSVKYEGLEEGINQLEVPISVTGDYKFTVYSVISSDKFRSSSVTLNAKVEKVVTAIDEIQPADKFNIFPNPVKMGESIGIEGLSNSLLNQGKYAVSVHKINGQRLSTAISMNKNELDIQGLTQPGVYIISIFENSNYLGSSKILVY